MEENEGFQLEPKKMSATERAAEVRRKMQKEALQRAFEKQSAAVATLNVERDAHTNLERNVRARMYAIERDARWVLLSRFISGLEDFHCSRAHVVRVDSQAQNRDQLQAEAAARRQAPPDRSCCVA